MSYANGTQYYNLPQTVGTDKRDWFDTNSAFAAVDAALHAAATGQAADAEAISTINSKLAADEADIAALQTASTTQAASISTLQTTVNAQASQIADVRQDAEDMITANNEGAAATSTRAYAIGDYFIYNDVLYKATAAIAIGDTIVPNTNCEATNVDTEITAVKSALSDFADVHGSSILGVGESKVLAANNPTSKYLVISFNTSEQAGLTRGCVVMPKRTMSSWFPLYCNGELMSVRLDYTHATNTFQFVAINKTQADTIYVTNIFE